MADFYIDTLDDLSYARSKYPNRQVRSYLNGLTRLLSLRIYRTQHGTKKGIAEFWRTELPLVMHQCRKQFLISFLIFAFATAIGVFSSMQDSSFQAYILGDNYVQMTLENIEKGDPMAVYKQAGETDMFLRITINNIRVAAMTFLFSIFIGLGTVFILLYNGIMLGSFQYFFVQRDLGFESFLTIWQHGTIEIFSIILAGMAGLVLASGVLFPGTYSRIDALRISARKSLLILIGIVPLLIYAGFVEGFVTRYTDMPWPIRLATILLCVAFIVVYFIWYPMRVAARTHADDYLRINLQPIKTGTFEKGKIIGNTQLTGNALEKIVRNLPAVFIPFLLLCVASIALLALFPLNIPLGSAQHPNFFFGAYDLFYHALGWPIFVINVWLFMAAYFGTFFILQKTHHAEPTRAVLIKLKSRFFTIVLLSFISALLVSNYYTLALMIVWLPISGLMAMGSIDKGESFFAQISTFIKISGAGLMKSIVIVVVISIIAGVASIFVMTLTTLVYEFLGTVIPSQLIIYKYFKPMGSMASSLLLALIAYVMSMVSSGLVYYGAMEKTYAHNLEAELDTLFPKSAESSINDTSVLSRSKLGSL